jgi:hypothetical protein
MVQNDGGLPAERRVVIAALVRHGLSALAAASLWRIGRTVLRDTRRRGREYSAMIDANTGIQTGPTLSGQAHQIDIRPQIAARQPGRAYGHVHTHPSNSAFSDADARVLLSNRELLAIVVIGLDDRWYIMSEASEASPADPWEATDKFILEFRRLLGRATIPMAELPHAVWSGIAADLGLRYDRIEGRTR